MILKIANPTPLNQVDGVPYENSHYFLYGDYKLHYRIDAPSGKIRGKMFMIHGFGCCTTFYDELVDEYVANGYKCVRVDLPDFGFSTREHKGINYVPRTEMLMALMDELDKADKKKQKWIVVGHSMGGSVTLDLADMSTEKMSAIMLYAPMFMFNVSPLLAKVFMLKPLAVVMNTALKFVLGYDALVKIVLGVATMNPWYIKNYDASKASAGLQVENTGTGLCYMSAKASHPDYEDMDKIDVPVLLVWGGLDLFVPLHKVIKLSNSLPEGTDIKRVWTGGHCLIQDHAPKCARFGIKFLKKNNLY